MRGAPGPGPGVSPHPGDAEELCGFTAVALPGPRLLTRSRGEEPASPGRISRKLWDRGQRAQVGSRRTRSATVPDPASWA